MKYGESFFDILYLLFTVISGVIILRNARYLTEKRMGMAVLILGCGDAFHLVPRVLNYFVAADFTSALGIGKLITSITMTVFYVFLFYIWRDFYKEKKNTVLTGIVWVLAFTRIILCMFPQNGWLRNSGNEDWGLIRNVPFILLGAVIIWLFFTKRRKERTFRRIWVYILLSFLFYIPVALGAGIVPMLGMLMLPKTICYILIVCAFLRCVGEKPTEGGQ